MPRVGSSRMSSFGSVMQPAGEQHLLLVAAAEVADQLFRVRRPDVERLDVAVDQLVLLLARDGAQPAAGRLQGQDDVLADRQLGDQALGAAVLRAERDAVRCRRRGASVGRRAVRRSGPCRESAWSAPNSRRATSVRPEPSRPARPTTSPGWIVQVERRDGALAPEPVGPHQRVRRPRGRVSDGRSCSSSASSVASSLPIILRHQLELRQLAGQVLADQAAVAQDRSCGR